MKNLLEGMSDTHVLRRAALYEAAVKDSGERASERERYRACLNDRKKIASVHTRARQTDVANFTPLTLQITRFHRCLSFPVGHRFSSADITSMTTRTRAPSPLPPLSPAPSEAARNPRQ